MTLFIVRSSSSGSARGRIGSDCHSDLCSCHFLHPSSISRCLAVIFIHLGRSTTLEPNQDLCQKRKNLTKTIDDRHWIRGTDTNPSESHHPCKQYQGYFVIIRIVMLEVKKMWMTNVKSNKKKHSHWMQLLYKFGDLYPEVTQEQRGIGWCHRLIVSLVVRKQKKMCVSHFTRQTMNLVHGYWDSRQNKM